jgi:hypothetical protein
MNTYLIFLSFSILLNACTSFYPLTDEDRTEGRPAPDESAVVYLEVGLQIEVESYHHIIVTEPSDFVYGVGLNKQTSRQFRGRLFQSTIDSSTTKLGSLTCWLKDGTSIVFRANEYVEVTPDGGTGFWCVGKYRSGGLFRGRVADEDIQRIEIRKTDVTKTVILAVVVGGVTFLIVDYVDKFRLGTLKE